MIYNYLGLAGVSIVFIVYTVFSAFSVPVGVVCGLAAGVGADIWYRLTWNEDEPNPWINPRAGGQLMFIPIYVWSILAAVALLVYKYAL